ncbi:hypothetical protein [Deminuibacter soli]|uniref:Uncharacterized protein n=1 Tax=Deminuibacter soli TaxID=2291815 RepID=A0A3E1NIA3_9BACT|nr:hypothetical protein [Deminuibacter soli]RFM27663.1 hypothetical protein DXN05_13205 [Deminuibacter soli]
MVSAANEHQANQIFLQGFKRGAEQLAPLPEATLQFIEDFQKMILFLDKQGKRVSAISRKL